MVSTVTNRYFSDGGLNTSTGWINQKA